MADQAQRQSQCASQHYEYWNAGQKLCHAYSANDKMQKEAAPLLESLGKTVLYDLPQRDEHPVKHPAEEELGATDESQS